MPHNGELAVAETLELRIDGKRLVEDTRVLERYTRPDSIDPMGVYLFFETVEIQPQQVNAAVDHEAGQTIGHLRHRIDELSSGQFSDVWVGKLVGSWTEECPDTAASVQFVLDVPEEYRLWEPDLPQNLVSDKEWRFMA